jgi:hypothetical protein
MKTLSAWRRTIWLTVAAALPAVFGATAFAAPVTVGGNLCSLLPGKQIAAIAGDTGASKYACVAQKTIKTAAGTTYGATAGAASPKVGGYFSIQVVKYSNPKVEALVEAQYRKSMKPAAGIGDWAYSRIAFSPVVGGRADTGQLAFGADGYGVVVNVRAKLKKTVNQPALKALAKTIASKL